MSEKERAHRLAKAIDRLMRGEEPDLDDQELAELLQVARLRRAASRQAQSLSEKYRDFVWARIEARIMQQLEQQGQTPGGITNPLAMGRTGAPEEDLETDSDELGDIISTRHRLSQEITDMAEAYRDLVWQRVQARIKASSTRQRRWFPLSLPWRRTEQEKAEELGQAIDQLILGEPIWEAADSSLKDLVRLARLRHAMSKALASSAAPYEGRLWTHLRPRLLTEARDRPGGPAQPRLRIPALSAAWPKLAAVALGLALLVLAVGPLPATGFANHPISQFVSFMGRLVGVSETDTPPPVTPPTVTIEGNDVTTAEAQTLLGLPVQEPGYLPQDFRQVSSQYFPGGITADQGGLFQLAYELADAGVNPATLIIWQEAVSPNTVAVQRGFAQALILDNGVEATYLEGIWGVEGSEMVWGNSDARTILFDAGPVRTFIVYLGGDHLDVQVLLSVANSMAGSQ